MLVAQAEGAAGGGEGTTRLNDTTVEGSWRDRFAEDRGCACASSERAGATPDRRRPPPRSSKRSHHRVSLRSASAQSTIPSPEQPRKVARYYARPLRVLDRSVSLESQAASGDIRLLGYVVLCAYRVSARWHRAKNHLVEDEEDETESPRSNAASKRLRLSSRRRFHENEDLDATPFNIFGRSAVTLHRENVILFAVLRDS